MLQSNSYFKVGLSNEGECLFRIGTTVFPTPAEASGNLHRLGSWSEFERRFKPIMFPDENNIPPYMDNCLMFGLHKILKCPEEHVWTVLDCDGRMVIAQGWRFVDRMGYIITKNRRTVGGKYKNFVY